MRLLDPTDPDIDKVPSEEIIRSARGWWARNNPRVALSLYGGLLERGHESYEAELVLARYMDGEISSRLYPRLQRASRLEPYAYWQWFHSLDRRPRQAAAVARAAVEDAADHWGLAIGAALLLHSGQVAAGADAVGRLLENENQPYPDDLILLIVQQILGVPEAQWLAAGMDPEVVLSERVDPFLNVDRPLTTTHVINYSIQERQADRAAYCLDILEEVAAVGPAVPGRVPWSGGELHRWRAEVAAQWQHDDAIALQQWNAYAVALPRPDAYVDFQRAYHALALRRCEAAYHYAQSSASLIKDQESVPENVRARLILAAELIQSFAFYYSGDYSSAVTSARSLLSGWEDIPEATDDLGSTVTILRVLFGLSADVPGALGALDDPQGSSPIERIERLDFLRWIGEHSPTDDARRYRAQFDSERREFMALFSDDAELLEARAYVALLGGDGIEAARLLDGAKWVERDLRVQTLKAHAAFASGNYEKALDAFRNIAAHRGYDLDTRQMVVSCLLALDRLEDAYVEADRLRKGAPGYLPGQSLVAQCLERLCDESDRRASEGARGKWRVREDPDSRALSYLLELIHRYRRMFELSDNRSALMRNETVSGLVGSETLTEDAIRFTAIRGARAVVRAETALRRAGLPFDRQLHATGEEFIGRLEGSHPDEAARWRHLLGKRPAVWRALFPPSARQVVPIAFVVVLIAVLVATTWWRTVRGEMGAELTTVLVGLLALFAVWPFVQKLTLPGGFGVEKVQVAEAVDNADVIRTTPVWITRFEWLDFEQPVVPLVRRQARPSTIPGTDRWRGVEALGNRSDSTQNSEIERSPMFFPRSVPISQLPPETDAPI